MEALKLLWPSALELAIIGAGNTWNRPGAKKPPMGFSSAARRILKMVPDKHPSKGPAYPFGSGHRLRKLLNNLAGVEGLIARLEGAGLGSSVTANIARELLASLERSQAFALTERDDLLRELGR